MTRLSDAEVRDILGQTSPHEPHSRAPFPPDIATPQAAARYLLGTLPAKELRDDHDPRRTAAIMALRPVADGQATDEQLREVTDVVADATREAVYIVAACGAITGVLVGWAIGRLTRR